MKKLLTLFTALLFLGSMTVVQAATSYYTPAGTPASVFTNEWTPNTPANDMTLSNGLYVFSKSITYSGDISFKVCKDHAWTTAYPGSNYSFTIPSGSKYLIITYKDDNTHEVNALAISSMTVAGDNATLFGSTWAPTNTANDMTLDGGVYKFEKSGVELAKGTVKLKACANHGWDNAWPSDNYSLSIPESGNYTITVTFDPATLAVTATADLEEAVVVIPKIQLHSNITNPSWESSADFALAANEETASLTLTGVTKGNYEFGVKIDGTWTSNGSAFTRDNNSHAVASGSGNCTFNADRNGDYTFTWTYATNTLEIGYPAIPSQSVTFNSLASQILKGSVINLANCVTSSGIDEPTYRFYIKEKEGEYGDAINANYNFNANGEYVVKVEALEYGEPVAYDESAVVVYQSYTFTNGSTIYVDFTAVSGDVKGVNYPKANEVGMDWDDAGAGTIKTVTFSADVQWTTNEVFIKTAKADWAGLKFSVPGEGQNKIIVAADGASYTWGTYVPTYYLKNNWNGCDWTWQAMTASEDKFRLENVVYGGNGINYNYIEDDAEAIWKDYAKIKYMDGATAKVVAAYDTVNLVLDPANDTIWAEMVNKDTVVVYTVAGNTMALFDLGWTATHPYKYTDMKKQEDGTYLWNYGGESATLTAGNLEFKVIKSRDYANGSWPENPFVYTIQRSGEYHITIHFNPCSKDIWVDTTLVKTLNIQDFTLKGSDDWETGHPLTMGEENDKALITLSLTEGEAYEFKLVTADDKWYGDGQAFTRTNAAHRNVVEVNAGANMTLQVDKTGEYLFTYFFDTEELLVQYPAIVPEDKIAPLSGKFTINAHGDTAVFARGNLQYNYELDAWYTAEQQYDVLGDLNLRLGDNTYQGSIDLFGWSSENSDFGKQWKYKDADFTGAFVDWGTQFADDEKEWSTLSKEEWNFLLARQKDGHKLWTMIAIGPDSLNGLALFPNDWEAPSGLTIKYGFYDLDNETDYKANAFTFEQWESMEAAGAVFLPLAGTRAGYYGNTWSGTAESSLSNPLASGYDWVDNVNWMGYYWLSTPNSSNVNQIATIILPGWHNNKWTAPTLWDRERRRGQSVRLVTRIPKVDWTEVRSGLEADRYYTVCLEKNITDFKGATFWNMTYKDQDEATIVYIVEETAPEAGKPYIIQATNDNEGKLEVIYGDEVAATPVENGALRGTFENIDADDFAALEGTVYLLINNAIRPRTTGNYLNAHRAYIRYDLLTVPQTQNFAPGRRVKSMPLQPKVATGMEQAEISDKPAKAIIEGQLFILRGEKMYDATGRQVK